MTHAVPSEESSAHSIAASGIVYRCTCGAECAVAPNTGCVCARCGRKVNAEALRYDLSATLDLRTSTPVAATTAPTGEALATTSPADDLCLEPQGCHLGHFEIVDLLGQGGMAQVYRALDRSLERYVAVKVLKARTSSAGTAGSDGSRDRLMQEAIAQARVNHPNIVAIYYVGQEDGKRFMAMELVHGEALNQRLTRTGPLPFDEVVSIAAQIVGALQASARLDLMHGDIKPSNILLQMDGVAKLSDFGLARCTSGPASDGIGGTPNYLAPELFSGGQPSIQSDMYSLGVTLFELSFGRLPKSLSGASVTEWAEALNQQPVQFPVVWPDHFPREWQRILKRLLAPDPNARYPNYESLYHDLQSIMPVKLQPARMFPRLFALGIDYFIAKPLIDVTILVTLLLLGQGRALLNFSEPMAMRLWRADMPWYMDMLNFALTTIACAVCAVAPLAYLAWVGYWGQSPGRALMHLRVVNRYGLRPKSRQLAARESMRLVTAMIALPVAIGALWSIPVIPLALTLVAVSLLISLVDFWFMITSRDGRSWHDRIFQTRVVLDTR